MGLSVAQLRLPFTSEQALALHLENLAALGLEVTSWQPGSEQLTMLLMYAESFSDLSEVVKDLAEFVYNDLASGDALTAFSDSQYDNQRLKAVKTVGTERLTSTALVPYTIQLGQLRFATANGVEFTNTVDDGLYPRTLPAGGFIDIPIESALAGAASLVGPNTITRLLTPLAGVTVSNPLVPGPDVWYTIAGVDEEGTSTLRTRNRTKWSRFSLELTRDAHINIALNAHPSIRRAEVHDGNPRGAGTIDVYIASAGGTSGIAEITAAQNAFAARAIQTDTYPANALSTRVLVKAAPAAPMNLAGTIYHLASVPQATVALAVTAALQGLLTEIPIGGFPYPAPGNVIPKNRIERAIEGAVGVKAVELTTPTGDITIAAFAAATAGDWSGLLYQAVSG